MPKHRQNRGLMRAARMFNTAKQHDGIPAMPTQMVEKHSRVQLSWSTPDYPGAYAHVVDVFDKHGNTTLRVVLENRRHIEFTIALHDVCLTQHPEHDPNRNAKHVRIDPFNTAKRYERYDPRYAKFELIKKEKNVHG